MSVLTDALRDFVSLFERLEAPYVLMGGFAVRVYGIPRPTYDADGRYRRRAVHPGKA